jgi:hypothetical protein
MFERFTQQARRVVVGAQEEARGLGHSWIGTEHLLLGLLHDEDGGPLQALAGVGVQVDAVRSEIEKAVPRGEVQPVGHIPFTPRAKKVLELALREALRLKHRTIEAEHILLGLLREGQGVAAQVLTKLGPDVDTMRQAVVQHLAGWPAPGPRRLLVKPDVTAMTPAGAATFELANQLAARGPVGSQHILRGLFAEENSLAVRALSALGVSPEAVERELERLDATETADEPPEQAGARKTRLHIAGDIITMRLQDAALASRLSSALGQLASSPGEAVEVAGTEPEAAAAFAQLWRALERASTELAGKLGRQSASMPAFGEWKPPGWSTRASVAGYSVHSEPDGPRARLWTAEGVDEAEVRRWLGQWLQTGPPLAAAAQRDAGPGCTYLTIHVGRKGEIEPGSDDPDGWTVASVSFGPGPAPADWPRVPLDDLVAFAVGDLSEAPAA